MLAERGERVGGAEQFVPLRCALAYRCLLVGRAVERAQRTDQEVGDGDTLIGPEATDVGVRGAQRGGVNCGLRVQVVRPEGNGQRFGEVPLEQARVAFGRVAFADKEGDQFRRQGVAGNVATPEIMHRLHQQIAVVLDELHCHGQAGGEGIVAQRALAEAVNGEDGRFVEGSQRKIEPADQVFFGNFLPFREFIHEGRHERVTAGSDPAHQVIARFDDPGANPLAQFGGCRIGEGHHQDLLHVEATFEQQAQIQSADVPGLAGAGGRLDQVDAVEVASEHVEVRDAAHSLSSSMQFIIAENTVLAHSSKSSSSGSSMPRRASR